MEPMQRYWSAPQADEATLDYQMREFRAWCGSYSAKQLRSAYDWLKENYTYKTWPKIADWKKAVYATAQKGTAETSEEKPWARMMKQAGRIADAEMDSPLGEQAEHEGWARDLHAAYKRLAYDALVKGRTTDNLVIESASIKFWRKRAASYRAAALYRQSPEYLSTHAEPYKFRAAQ